MSRPLRSLVLVAAVIMVVFSVGVLVLFFKENAQWVVVRVPAAQARLGDPFYVVEYESPLWAIMLASLGAGCGLTVLALVPSWIRRAVDRNRDQRYIRELEGELSDLRNLAITAPAPLEDLPASASGAAASVGDEAAFEESSLALDEDEPKARAGR